MSIMKSDYKYGKGTTYDDGTEVLILEDYRKVKFWGNFKNRIGIATFDELWVVNDDGSKELWSKNYPSIKLGRFLKTEGMKCDWIPLEEAKKYTGERGNKMIIKKNRLKRIVRK